MNQRNLEQVLQYNYKQADYADWLKGFAQVLGAGIKKNSLSLPLTAGTGFSKSYLVEEGFSCCVQDYSLCQDIEFNRIASGSFGVLIHFYYFKFDSPIEYRLENNTELGREKEEIALRLVNASASQQVKFYKGTSVKGLSIYLDNKWIKENLSETLTKIFNYIERINYLKENIQVKYQKLLFEIIHAENEHPFHDIYIKSRVLRLLDTIFQTLLKRDVTDHQDKLSDQDFEMLQKVEQILIDKFSSPFPSIERLARISLMSESKLKKLFKQAFGMGMYEYYQKNRLQKAKELILLNKHSVSEVGKMLGYQNLSNFSVAFKKEFNCLPSEIIRLN